MVYSQDHYVVVTPYTHSKLPHYLHYCEAQGYFMQMILTITLIGKFSNFLR